MALVVFTGGARSGKSTAAQDLARRRSLEGQRVVVAVFGQESDPEMAARIRRHLSDRPDRFETLVVEDPSAWLGGVEDDVLLVVDCLGTLVGRLMEQAWDDNDAALNEAGDVVPSRVEDAVVVSANEVVADLLRRRGDTIVVTNEVGDGVVPAFASGRLFRDVLGGANRRLTDAADLAYLCVAGRLVELTALSRTACWPED